MPRNGKKQGEFRSLKLAQAEQALTSERLQVADAQQPAHKTLGLKKMPQKLKAKLAEQRIETATEFLVNGVSATDTVRKIVLKEGVAVRTARNAVARARERLSERLSTSREDHIAQSLAFYLAIAGDTKNCVRDRIRARERYDQLLGLDAPRRIHAQVDTTMMSHEGLMAIVRAHYPAIIVDRDKGDDDLKLQLTSGDNDCDASPQQDDTGDNGDGEDDDDENE